MADCNSSSHGTRRKSSPSEKPPNNRRYKHAFPGTIEEWQTLQTLHQQFRFPVSDFPLSYSPVHVDLLLLRKLDPTQTHRPSGTWRRPPGAPCRPAHRPRSRWWPAGPCGDRGGTGRDSYGASLPPGWSRKTPGTFRRRRWCAAADASCSARERSGLKEKTNEDKQHFRKHVCTEKNSSNTQSWWSCKSLEKNQSKNRNTSLDPEFGQILGMMKGKGTMKKIPHMKIAIFSEIFSARLTSPICIEKVIEKKIPSTLCRKMVQLTKKKVSSYLFISSPTGVRHSKQVCHYKRLM